MESQFVSQRSEEEEEDDDDIPLSILKKRLESKKRSKKISEDDPEEHIPLYLLQQQKRKSVDNKRKAVSFTAMKRKEINERKKSAEPKKLSCIIIFDNLEAIKYLKSQLA